MLNLHVVPVPPIEWAEKQKVFMSVDGPEIDPSWGASEMEQISDIGLCSLASTQMDRRLQRFGLTLVVNHACNLRCAYCYTGAKFNSPMSLEMGVAAIERGFCSLVPDGNLDLGFFGGEPLIQASRILDWMRHSRHYAMNAGKRVNFNLTTNGTIRHQKAWQVMLAEDLDLAVSFDGDPQLHDRHRRDVQGRGSAAEVVATLHELMQAGKLFQVIVVIRPDNLEEMPESLKYLHALGVREVNLSLDLWTSWTAEDGCRLQRFVEHASTLWHAWLPDFSLNWFDAKAGEMARLPVTQETSRCAFGHGEIAVAPSGRLYPCERLVGEDGLGNPFLLPGHALAGQDFLDYGPASFQQFGACSRCVLATVCDTGCRCSNFVRTGDVNRPDGLLCLLNKATARAVAKVFHGQPEPASFRNSNAPNERPCYV